jgi:thiamine-phosphate pyrophosphorylase
MRSDRMKVDYSLYLVTDRKILNGQDLYTGVEKAIKGGVTLVQLREKNASSREFYSLGKEIKELTDIYDIPLIINDRLDIALAIDADGLHIGNDDLPIEIARDLLGTKKLLGYSASSLKEAQYGEKAGADYLGVGAVFPTDTKKNVDRVSLEELKNIKEKVNIPVVGIGGINIENVHQVLETGVDGIAVVSAILGKDNITGAAAELKRTITGYPGR